MKLEYQVCSLELSKRLKELGVKQESQFYWLQYSEWNLHFRGKYVQEYYSDCLSAFTVAELGYMLPNSIRVDGKEPFDTYTMYTTKFYSVNFEMKKTNNFVVNYQCDTTELDGFGSRKLTQNFYDPNEANARAMMLIYLIENKIIEAPK